MVLEIVSALKDADGNARLDANGRFMKDPAAAAAVTVNVMRKEKGFGSEYKDNRNGEWEYAGYRPDGTYATLHTASANCAIW